MDDFNIIVGKRIRKLREKNGYSREKFGELAGINDKFLYEVEVGRKGLSLQKMYKISRALNVSMDFLVTGEQADEKYMVVKSLMSIFNETEMKNIENIIQQIIIISKPK